MIDTYYVYKLGPGDEDFTLDQTLEDFEDARLRANQCIKEGIPAFVTTEALDNVNK